MRVRKPHIALQHRRELYTDVHTSVQTANNYANVNDSITSGQSIAHCAQNLIREYNYLTNYAVFTTTRPTFEEEYVSEHGILIASSHNTLRSIRQLGIE